MQEHPIETAPVGEWRRPQSVLYEVGSGGIGWAPIPSLYQTQTDLTPVQKFVGVILKMLNPADITL